MCRQELSPPKGAEPPRQQRADQGESVASYNLGFEVGLGNGAADAGPNQRRMADGSTPAKMGDSSQPDPISAGHPLYLAQL